MISTDGIAVAGGALLSVGVAAVVLFGFLVQRAPLLAIAHSYIAVLERDLAFNRSKSSGARICVCQVICVVGAAVFYSQHPTWWAVFFAVAAVIGPFFAIRLERRKRLEKLEDQLDGWLMMLGNMLRATGSLTEAIISSTELTRGPLAEELETVLKEVRLGHPLGRALQDMANRLKSPPLSTVVTIILVGRQTGGELPALLETTAESLREMRRLEGVLRTKTAQGKAQLFVLVVAPMVIFTGFQKIEPTFFDPLMNHIIGYGVIALAVLFWISSIFWAKKILDVDI